MKKVFLVLLFVIHNIGFAQAIGPIPATDVKCQLLTGAKPTTQALMNIDGFPHAKGKISEETIGIEVTKMDCLDMGRCPHEGYETFGEYNKNHNILGLNLNLKVFYFMDQARIEISDGQIASYASGANNQPIAVTLQKNEMVFQVRCTYIPLEGSPR